MVHFINLQLIYLQQQLCPVEVPEIKSIFRCPGLLVATIKEKWTWQIL